MQPKHLLMALVIALSITSAIAYPFVMYQPEEAQRVLAAAGYKDIQTGGYAWFTCDKNDAFATAFTATSPSGQRVSGAVCSGLLEGNTIRFD